MEGTSLNNPLRSPQLSDLRLIYHVKGAIREGTMHHNMNRIITKLYHCGQGHQTRNNIKQESKLNNHFSEKYSANFRSGTTNEKKKIVNCSSKLIQNIKNAKSSQWLQQLKRKTMNNPNKQRTSWVLTYINMNTIIHHNTQALFGCRNTLSNANFNQCQDFYV